MKTKWLSVAVFASVAMIAQANPGGFHAGTGASHGGAVAHRAPAVHAPMRPGGFSSFHSTPMRAYGSRPFYSGQRYSSFGMRTYRPTGFRQPSIYRDRATFTRSGPFTAATIRQPHQSNRFPRFASYRNQRATSVWNQRNTGIQFGNGNNHLRADWRNHVFSQRSANWHGDWDRHSDHWWNGHRCHFFNGSWVIFNIGFDPLWPYAYSPDSYAYGSPYYGGYDYPNSSGYDSPYSYDYQPGDYDSGDYQGQQYYDQNSYPDQSHGYYDSSVYQTESYDDQNQYDDHSTNSIVVRAQERLAREGYYRGETDGALNPEMQKAVRRYQITNGLRPTGDLDSDTLAVMGLRNGTSY